MSVLCADKVPLYLTFQHFRSARPSHLNIGYSQVGDLGLHNWIRVTSGSGYFGFGFIRVRVSSVIGSSLVGWGRVPDHDFLYTFGSDLIVGRVSRVGFVGAGLILPALVADITF